MARARGRLGNLPKKTDGVFGSRSIQHDRTAKERWAGAPYFLLGHSMGSFVARQYTVKYGWALDGVIYMGTSGKNPLNWAGIALTNMLGRMQREKSAEPADRQAGLWQL